MLSRHRVGDWLVIALPVLRFVTLHPAPQFADLVRRFRGGFTGDFWTTAEWTSLVLAEADAALASIAAAPR